MEVLCTLRLHTCMELTFAVQVQGPEVPSCGLPEFKGDGNCDDANNLKECVRDCMHARDCVYMCVYLLFCLGFSCACVCCVSVIM